MNQPQTKRRFKQCMNEFSKYFLAIIPNDPVFSLIEGIKKECGIRYNTKGALRSPAHITLHMPFEWKESKEDELLLNLEQFNFLPFNIHLNNYNCFEPRVIFIDVKKNEELIELQKKLVHHIKKNLNIFNQSDDKRGFHPHVTIAFRDLKKNQFYSAWSELKEKVFEGSFICNSFYLLKQNEQQWIPYRELKFKPTT